jgi:hypothetical protein
MTVRSVVLLVSGVEKVTVGSAPNLPVTLIFAELAPGFVATQAVDAVLLFVAVPLLQATSESTTAATAIVLRNFDTILLSGSHRGTPSIPCLPMRKLKWARHRQLYAVTPVAPTRCRGAQ